MHVDCALTFFCRDENRFDFRESGLTHGCLLRGACAFCCLSRGPGREFELIALVHDVANPKFALVCIMAFEFDMAAGFATAVDVECT